MRISMTRAPGALAMVVLVAATLTSCHARQAVTATAPKADQDGDRPYWPARAWKSSTPEAQGMDAAGIEAALGAIRGGATGIRSLLVVKNGYLVSETYFEGYDKDRPGEVYSVTKSVVSTLVGIAIDRGQIAGLSVSLSDESLFGPLPDADPGKRAITIEQLLTMTSGLEWKEGDAAYRAFYLAGDALAYVKNLPMAAAPGTVFNYDSAAVHLLSAAIRRGTGMDPADYARRFLFGPLGIGRFEWEKDRTGLAIGGWGLRLTPRDMAKLGYLFLRGGVWNGRRVVSREWIEAATRARVVDTGSAEGLGYGYLWWTCPEFDGYAALGLDGQIILVVPKSELVVVVTAATPDRGHRIVFALLRDYVLPASRPQATKR